MQAMRTTKDAFARSSSTTPVGRTVTATAISSSFRRERAISFKRTGRGLKPLRVRSSNVRPFGGRRSWSCAPANSRVQIGVGLNGPEAGVMPASEHVAVLGLADGALGSRLGQRRRGKPGPRSPACLGSAYPALKRQLGAAPGGRQACFFQPAHAPQTRAERLSLHARHDTAATGSKAASGALRARVAEQRRDGSWFGADPPGNPRVITSARRPMECTIQFPSGGRDDKRSLGYLYYQQ